MYNDAKLGLIGATDLAQDNEAIELLFLYAQDTNDKDAAKQALARINAWANNLCLMPNGVCIVADKKGRLSITIEQSSERIGGLPQKMQQLMNTIAEKGNYTIPIKRTLLLASTWSGSVSPWRAEVALTTSTDGASTISIKKLYGFDVVNSDILASPTFIDMFYAFIRINENNIEERFFEADHEDL